MADLMTHGVAVLRLSRKISETTSRSYKSSCSLAVSSPRLLNTRYLRKKGLEVGEYEFSKYIPQYLGQAALWLPPEQLEEIVSYLHGMMANANDQIVSVALDTVGVLLERYSCYPERFAEEKEVIE